MYKKLFILALCLVSAGSIIPQRVYADGAIVHRPYYPVYENGQKALLIYDAASKTEELVLSVSFDGSYVTDFGWDGNYAADFGWVVPVPAKPEVNKAAKEIFTDLGKATQPQKTLLEKLRGEEEIGILTTMTNSFGLGSSKNYQESVTVVEEKQVGILDVAVLSSTNSKALMDWLSENGYQLPNYDKSPNVLYDELEASPTASGETRSPFYGDYDEEVNPLIILQDYIDSEWYFVAAKVNAQYSSTSISAGQIAPLRLTFETQEPVYPMRLTALGKRSSAITLYVVAENKMEVKGLMYEKTPLGFGIPSLFDSDTTAVSTEYFTISYGRWFEPDEIKKFTTEINKSSWYASTDRVFLTKLEASYFPYTKMDQDLRFEKSKNNDSVNAGIMKWYEWMILPVYIFVCGPYWIVATFLGLPMWYSFGSLQSLIFLFILLGGGALVVSIGGLFLLKKIQGRKLRLLCYGLQIPAVAVLSYLVALLFIIPFGIVLAMLGVSSSIIWFNVVVGELFLAVFAATLFYELPRSKPRYPQATPSASSKSFDSSTSKPVDFSNDYKIQDAKKIDK